jgi:acetoin utilization deacetylase AcuC-like enzyme
VGRDDGLGFTVNVPIERGATDADYEMVFDAIVVPVTRQFQPDLVLVSAGFDAHAEDPLGGMRMSAAGFGRLTGRLCAVADACAGGRLVLVTEGGYHLRALAESLAASLGAMEGRQAGAAAPPASDPAGTGRGAEAVRLARAAQAPFWRGL